MIACIEVICLVCMCMCCQCHFIMQRAGELYACQCIYCFRLIIVHLIYHHNSIYLLDISMIGISLGVSVIVAVLLISGCTIIIIILYSIRQRKKKMFHSEL